MPLKCLRNGVPIFAFDVEVDSAWDELREENAKRKSLRMTCCDTGVTLRTSKLGTRHFAHARRGTCATAPETAEHLLAKRVIVDAIRQTDWQPMPEQPGASPGFGAWIADVMATKAQAKIAFEIQWSRQDEDETRHRQKRYRAAGVRGLWLFRQHDFPLEKETPAFRLVFDETQSRFTVQLPSQRYDPRWISQKEKDEKRYWQQTIELTEFVKGALLGKLRYAPALGAAMPLEVHAASTACWKCKKETQVILDLVFAASRVFPGCEDICLNIYSFEDAMSDGARIIMDMLPSSLLRQHGIGALKPRYSKAMGGSYLSNGCVHCDALQGKFFEHELAFESKKLLEIEAIFRKEWGATLEDAANDIYRWWFDSGN